MFEYIDACYYADIAFAMKSFIFCTGGILFSTIFVLIMNCKDKRVWKIITAISLACFIISLALPSQEYAEKFCSGVK